MKCQRDIHMLQKDLHMMMASAKKHDSEHLEKEVKFLEHELPNMETDCEMKGMCKKDFDALEGMTQRLEAVVEAKNWKATDEALMVLFKSFKAAGQDCMHHKTGRKHHKKHHRHHKVTHKLHKMDFLKQYKRTDDDQCKADITNMMADIRKMVEDVKAHNANATEATLKYIVDHMPQLEKQCQLQGDCAKDFWMVDGLAKRMMESVAKGDWNATDQYLRDMDEVFHKAHSDCQAGPGPSPDQCKQDAENLEADVHKIFESTHARDQKAVEAELQYLIKEMPMFEDACHLAGQCRVDMDHIQRIAEWALNNTMAGDWNHTEEALHRMMEVFQEAKHDCHDSPTPPSPEECHKSEWVMEETLQGLVASATDKFQEGVMHFAAELEHRVFWIERACQLHDMCKADWDRIGHISHGIYDEAKRNNWETTDAAVMEVVAIVQTDIHSDCEHTEKLPVFEVMTRTGGIMECVQDIEGVVNAAKDIISQAKSGNPDIATILADAQEIVSDIKKAESDCVSSEVKVQAGDLSSCIADVEDLVENAKDILSQVQSGKPNFSQLLTDAQNIMADVKKAQTDCTLAGIGNTNILNCAKDVADMVKNAKDIVSQATSSKPDFSRMLQDVSNISNDVTKAQTDCKLANEFRFPRYHNGDCKADMATLAKEAFQLLKDASARNWTKMLEELPEMIATIKQAEADCQ